MTFLRSFPRPARAHLKLYVNTQILTTDGRFKGIAANSTA